MTTEQTTGDDGKVTFENLEYGDYTATISKDGYVTKTENIAFRNNHKNFSITLVESGGTGTVTVTCVDSQATPLSKVNRVALYTGDVPPIEDDSMMVAGGYNDSGNVVELLLWDTATHQLTEDKQIPFGTYNVRADGEDTFSNPVSYSGTLTVDGNEEITITLTEE